MGKKCSFPEGLTIHPDEVHELDLCVYEEVERFRDGVIEKWGEIGELLCRVFGIANDAITDLADVDAQLAVDKRTAERKRWGHPPRKLASNYQQPMKKVKPNARSCTHKRGSQCRA